MGRFNPATLAIGLLLLLKGNDTLVTDQLSQADTSTSHPCSKQPGGTLLEPGGQFIEAVIGEPLVIACRLCTTSTSAHVAWQKGGVAVIESADLRSYRRHRGEFVLRMRSLREDQLGNYTCLLSDSGHESYDVRGAEKGRHRVRREEKEFVVSLSPPPPTWEIVTPEETAGGLVTSRELRWRGLSSLAIINYQLEVRLRPEAGEGEDWVSIVVPYQAPVQSYILQGLNPGTAYEARLRSRTSKGLSPHSTILSFSTVPPAAPTPAHPTMYSLPREDRKPPPPPLLRFSSAGSVVLPGQRLLLLLTSLIALGR